MLLQVQPFLVVTEEMMVDVLTTMRTTYIPTTRWGVLAAIDKIRVGTDTKSRKITYAKLRTLWNERKDKRAAAKRRKTRRGDSTPPPPAPSPPQPRAGAPHAREAEEEDEEAEWERVMFEQMEGVERNGGARRAGRSLGGGDEELSPQEEELARLEREEREQNAQFRICDDKNYYAFTFTDMSSACDYFSSEGSTRISSSVFRQVLQELKHERVWHIDRNRPEGHEENPNAYQCAGADAGMDPALVYKIEIQSPVVVIESIPYETIGGGGGGAGPYGHHHHHHRGARMGGGSNGIQVCVLAHYLDQKRKESVNEVLAKGLSYRGARERDIVTACGVTDRHWVHNKGAREKQAVVSEFLDVIHVRPDPAHRLSRVNHFPESDLTDAFVYDQSLDRSGTRAPDWGDSATDMSRRIKIRVGKCLDETILKDYWHRAGLPVRREWFPWEHTRELREIASRGVDRTGVPTSSRIRQRYPQDFRAPRRPRRPRRRPAEAAEEPEEGTTTTTTTTAAADPMEEDDEGLISDDDDADDEGGESESEGEAAGAVEMEVDEFEAEMAYEQTRNRGVGHA